MQSSSQQVWDFLSSRFSTRSRATAFRSFSMFDAILIAAGVGFFVLAIVYTAACDRL
jgi:hypothetical protein